MKPAAFGMKGRNPWHKQRDCWAKTLMGTGCYRAGNPLGHSAELKTSATEVSGRRAQDT